MKKLIFIFVVFPSFAASCPTGMVAMEYDNFVSAVSGACPAGYVAHYITDVCTGDTTGACWVIEQLRELCGTGISTLKTSSGLSFPLFADKSTSPAIHISYNGGICYADLTVGQEINAINVNFNGTVYHTIAASSDNTGGDNTGSGSTGGGNTGGDDTGGGNTGGDDTGGDSGEEEVFNDYKFTAITTRYTTEFSFDISAAGTFYVDWGDGDTEIIEKPNTTNTPYSHTYTTAGVYEIKLGGLATGYNSDTSTAAIDFNKNASLGGIDGCLGCIFPTLSDGTQPRFYSTFYNTNITSIPDGLFAGINGAPASSMFFYTFRNTPITSIPEDLFAGIKGAPASSMFCGTFYGAQITSIPEDLFAGINGAPASSMFYNTFAGTDLISIPGGLFAGINGAPASHMFDSTFSGTQITSIPSGLFSRISGAPADWMFYWTFSGTQITSIPDGLFAGIDTTAPLQNYSFNSTFYNCSALTGPSARINGQYLYEIWPDATSSQAGDMYSGATGLSDYAQIPSVWK